MKRIRLNRFATISFVTGFCLLTYELVAARVLAPTIGSSTYVWTSVIGVIIASLALGFWVGGKVADARDQARDLIVLLCLASFTSLITLLAYQGVLQGLVGSANDIRLVAIYAAVILFAPTSFVIGMTSPYLAKLNVRSLKTTGQHVASLDALNSLGGIVGTFLTGFVLFGYVGSRQTFLVVIGLLLAASFLVAPRYRLRERFIVAVVIGFSAVSGLAVNVAAITIDTPSAHYEIRNYRYDGELIRGLTTGPGGIQSAIPAGGTTQPVFWYTRMMADLALDRQPKRILILGGGAFTLPQFLAEKLPDSQIDVVEIDPGLGTISRDHFGYEDPANVRLIFADARTFVNQTDETYDLILVDAYGDADVPYSMMTREYGRAVGRLVTDDGVLVANIIAGFSGACREVLDAMNAAYTQALPIARYAIDEWALLPRTNIIALYSRKADSFGDPMPLYTEKGFDDNYAPAERLHYACQQVVWTY